MLKHRFGRAHMAMREGLQQRLRADFVLLDAIVGVVGINGSRRYVAVISSRVASQRKKRR